MKKRYILAWRFLLLVALYRRTISTYGWIQHALLLFINRIMHHPFGIVLFCCLYLIRPFVLIPVAWLSIIAGTFRWWRPWVLIALGGELVSACIAFANGKHLSRDALDSKNEEAFGRFSFILLRYPLLAVIFSRMSPIPDDVVNYWRGILRISRKTYFWWSLLWNAPFSLLNVAMWVQIDPAVLLTEGFKDWISRSSLLIVGTIYTIVLIISTIAYKHVSAKEE